MHVRMKQGDRFPKLRVKLIGPDGPISVDSTVRFLMRPKGGGPVKVDGTATATATGTGTVVEYAWTEGDTDTAGEFEAEFEVTTTGGLKATYPNGNEGAEYVSVVIVDDIA